MTIARHNLTPTSDQTPVIVEISTKKPSGRSWVSEFPTSVSLDDLAAPFATKATAFIAALRAAGATVSISATLRPANRAFLMHWAWQIVNNNADPQTVPEREGIDIEWAHQDDAGAYSRVKSVAGAKAMVNAYGMQNLKTSPSLTSRHIEGNAIDTTISWAGTLTINNASGTAVIINTEPRTEMNLELHAVGKTYGVIKFLRGDRDKPHWSTDGK